MRIVLGKYANDTKVFANDGKDITSSLGMTSISIFAEVGDFVKVEMTCYVDKVDLEVDKSHLTVNSITHSPYGSGPKYSGNPYAAIAKAIEYSSGTNPKPNTLPEGYEWNELKQEIVHAKKLSPEATLDSFKLNKIGEN